MDREIVAAAQRLAKHQQQGEKLELALVAALNTTTTPAKVIAREIGITQQYLSDVKKGRRSVSKDLVKRLAGMIE